ncbi:MAG: hypothetical protein D3924_11840 [Candidatus Electrothrix sp. AR4]|nr:hypothetical protein [Candidatus Electrothrix sp. AR4]
MATWIYEAFESINSGREGVTELEHRVTEKMETLGLQAKYAKVAMTNIVGGTARAVIYYPDSAISLAPINSISGWTKGDVNTIADSSDTERFKEEMYQEIKDLLNSLSEVQAVQCKISATAYKNGYSTITSWYPSKIS